MKTIFRSYFTCYDKTRIILKGCGGKWRWYYLGTLYYWDFEKSRGKWNIYQCTASGQRELYARRINLSEALQVAKNVNERDGFKFFFLGGATK